MDDPIITTPEPDEPSRGRVLQTFLVRVTLRANEDGTEGDVPTNERMADAVHRGVYEGLYQGPPAVDFAHDAINVTAEKV